ncbi:MAG: hypothetical protein OXE44_00745 [Nitrospinae bacterium]|nr:hypothetical protein [Nitrospinota bacterium]
MGLEIWTTEKQFEEAKIQLGSAVDIIFDLLPEPPPKPKMEDRESVREFIETARQMSNI